MSQNQASLSIHELRVQVSHMLDSLVHGDPIAASVVFSVDAPSESTFVQNAAALAEATNKMRGVKLFVYQKQKSIQGPEPHSPQYLIYEEWDSVTLFRHQWDSPHLKHFQHTVGELLVAAPDLRFYYDHKDAAAMARVLKTGQTKCWDAGGAAIQCAGTGGDGDIQAGVAIPAHRFIDNNDGTVTDKLTGLIWLKDANRFRELPWARALETVKQLGNDGNSLTDSSAPGDWRLPNVNELLSLLDLDNQHGPPLPARHPFLNVEVANYWTSSSVGPAPALGWYVAMAVGCHVFDLKVNAMRIWPVRDGQAGAVGIARTGLTKCYDSFGQEIDCAATGQDGCIQAGVPFPVPRFVDNLNGTVTDKMTGLIWLQNADRFGTRTWYEALRDCNSLAGESDGLTDASLAGDWRLPNVNELRSLIDFSNSDSVLPTGHKFSNVRSSLYWSSTTVASAPSLARFLFVGLGSAVWDHKSVRMHVWPVKGAR